MPTLVLIIEDDHSRHPEFAGIAVEVEATPKAGDVLVFPILDTSNLGRQDARFPPRPLAFEVPNRIFFIPSRESIPGHYIAWRKPTEDDVEDGDLLMYALGAYGFRTQPIPHQHSQPNQAEAATTFLQADEWRPTQGLLGFAQSVLDGQQSP